MSAAAESANGLAGLGFPNRTVLYVDEVATRLRVTKQHVINLIDEGILAAVNIGTGARKFYRIPVASFEGYLAKQLGTEGAAPAPVKAAAAGLVRRSK